jgi:hypothetical protein
MPSRRGKSDDYRWYFLTSRAETHRPAVTVSPLGLCLYRSGALSRSRVNFDWRAMSLNHTKLQSNVVHDIKI